MSEWAFFTFFLFSVLSKLNHLLEFCHNFPVHLSFSHIILMVFSSFSVIEWSKVLVSVIACDKVIWALMPDNVGYQSFKHPQKPYCNNVTVTYQTLPCYCNEHNPTIPNLSKADPTKWATIHQALKLSSSIHVKSVMTERIKIWEWKSVTHIS